MLFACWWWDEVGQVARRHKITRPIYSVGNVQAERRQAEARLGRELSDSGGSGGAFHLFILQERKRIEKNIKRNGEYQCSCFQLRTCWMVAASCAFGKEGINARHNKEGQLRLVPCHIAQILELCPALATIYLIQPHLEPWQREEVVYTNATTIKTWNFRLSTKLEVIITSITLHSLMNRRPERDETKRNI